MGLLKRPEWRLCAVSKGTHVAAWTAPSGAFLVAAWPAEEEEAQKGLKSYVQSIFTPLLWAVIQIRLSQAFCCLQRKTCETLSMLVCWISVEMAAVERCRPLCRSADWKGLHSLMFCLPLPLCCSFKCFWELFFVFFFSFLSWLLFPFFPSLFFLLMLFELTSWQI